MMRRKIQSILLAKMILRVSASNVTVDVIIVVVVVVKASLSRLTTRSPIRRPDFLIFRSERISIIKLKAGSIFPSSL